MARRHIEIIPGKNGHEVRHFHAVNEGGTPAYAQALCSAMPKMWRTISRGSREAWEDNEPKVAAKAEEPHGSSEAAKAEKAHDDNSPAGLGGKRRKSLARKVEGHVE